MTLKDIIIQVRTLIYMQSLSFNPLISMCYNLYLSINWYFFLYQNEEKVHHTVHLVCSPCVDHSYNESQKAKVSYSQKVMLILLTLCRSSNICIFDLFCFILQERAAAASNTSSSCSTNSSMHSTTSTQATHSAHSTDGLRHRIPHSLSSQPVTMAR